jgi:hypothetical protein
MRRSTIRQIIAIHRGHDNVLETKSSDRLGDAPRLIRIERADFAMGYGTVGAIARADIAHEHEGGGVMRETFTDIRTACLLADAVQFQFAEDGAGTEILGRDGRANFDPVGMFPLNHIC